jgi:hypothetical protein
MVTANKDKFITSHKMLDWQYSQMLWDLGELQRHASDPTCPCRLSKDLGENCLAKHSLALSGIAAETAAMDAGHFELLMDLSAEAKEKHEGMRAFLCDKEDEPEFMDWSRQWRKKVEPLYYYGYCKLELHQDKTTVCTPAQKKRRERCIKHIKAANTARRCSRPEGTGTKRCPNVFAVCNKSIGCRIGKAS